MMMNLKKRKSLHKNNKINLKNQIKLLKKYPKSHNNKSLSNYPYSNLRIKLSDHPLSFLHRKTINKINLINLRSPHNPKVTPPPTNLKISKPIGLNYPPIITKLMESK